MKIKATMRYYFTFITMTTNFLKRQKITSVGEDVVKSKPSYTSDGNVKQAVP